MLVVLNDGMIIDSYGIGKYQSELKYQMKVCV